MFISTMDVQKTLHKTKNFRAQYDFVTARAGCRMQVLSELTIPYHQSWRETTSTQSQQCPRGIVRSQECPQPPLQ